VAELAPYSSQVHVRADYHTGDKMLPVDVLRHYIWGSE
jgi:hypothetical protein